MWHDWSWMRFGGRKAEAGTGQLGLPMTSQRTVPVLSKFPALFLQNAASGHSTVELDGFGILICFVFSGHILTSACRTSGEAGKPRPCAGPEQMHSSFGHVLGWACEELLVSFAQEEL